MKASGNAAGKVKRLEKIGDLHKDSGLFGSNALAKLSRHIEPISIRRDYIRSGRASPHDTCRQPLRIIRLALIRAA
jgi:hypothetical protein